MPLEIKIGDKISTVKLIKQENSNIEIQIDNKIYQLDIEQVQNGVYSILYKNKSYNVELIQGSTRKNYYVNTSYNTFDVEIIDAQSKYLESRKKNSEFDSGDVIASPMPGKIVNIPVEKGMEVKQGDTVIVVSAMKMESDYKAGRDAVIKDILVKEDQNIEGHQPLVILE
jgi:biotin carboxyl carrier protein